MTGLTILGLQDAFYFIECAEGDKNLAKPSPALYIRNGASQADARRARGGDSSAV